MKKNLKSIVAMGLTLSLLGANTMTAFAGAWNQGSDGAWTYEIEEGQNAIGWNWIDGMNYYFDESGKMLADTVTPDGHTVDANGAWTVDGVVQLAEVVAAQDAQTEDAVVETTTTETVVEETQASGYSQDSQYPLAHLKDWFVVSQFGYLEWAWDFMYLELEVAGIDKAREYRLNSAATEQNPMYLYDPEHTTLLALAKLAGVPLTGYESQVNDEQVVGVETEIRKFLESFDWQNASDLEKAIQIAKRIRQAEYKYSSEYEYAGFPYGCLVGGYANCGGYTSTALLLSKAIDLSCLSSSIVTANHTYPVFLVDGVWLGFEGTSDSKKFFLADYEDDITTMYDGVQYLGLFAEYVTRTGYTMPSYESIYEQFPNVRNYIKYGENMPGIYFD